MKKKYNIREERQSQVSEPAVVKDSMVSKKEESEVSFQREWDRAIPFEEFREECHRRIDEIYGKA